MLLISVSGRFHLQKRSNYGTVLHFKGKLVFFLDDAMPEAVMSVYRWKRMEEVKTPEVT